MKYNYKKRKNNEFKLITNRNSFTDSTTKLLKKNYNYIFHSIKSEGYKIEYDHFDIIQEIVYDEKVVGFISLIHVESIKHILCINEAYILPEHRNKGLFYQCILNLLSQPNLCISLRNPNRKIIDLLIEYNFAKKLKNNLVISYIDLYCDYSNRYLNSHIKEYYKLYDKSDQKEMIKSNFYDLNINSAVFFDEDNLLTFNENPAYIEKARTIDSKDKYYLKLKNVDLTYLNVLYDCFLNIDDILEELSVETEERINENLNIEDILGNEKELTPIFIEFLEEHGLTINEGKIIRHKVVQALKHEEIIPKSIILRTMYLMNHIDENDTDIDYNIELGKNIQEECPYCHTVNYSFLEVCEECGYNLQRNNHFEEYLPQNINKNFLLYEFITSSTLHKSDYNIKYGLNKLIFRELNYTDLDEEEIFKIQCKIATYQLLKNINDSIYFDVYDFDSNNELIPGSTFYYSKKHDLITHLNDYSPYYDIMRIFFSDNNLRDILNRNNLDTFGNRDELIFRIENELSPEDIFGNKYCLTNKGYEYLRIHEKYDLYEENLYDFLFYDVFKFKQEYKGNDFEKTFIKYMLNDAIKNNNYFRYHRFISYKLNHIKEFSDYYLVLFMVLFIIDINFFLNQKEIIQKPLSEVVIRQYPEIKEIFEYVDVGEIFYKALKYIKIDFLKDNEDLVLFYFIKSLNYEDIDDINREIEEEKFNRIFLDHLLSEKL